MILVMLWKLIGHFIPIAQPSPLAKNRKEMRPDFERFTIISVGSLAMMILLVLGVLAFALGVVFGF